MTRERLSSVAAIVFALFFTAAVIMLSSIPVGGGASTDEEIRSFYGESGDRTGVIIGLYLAAAAAICFLLFLAGLHRSRHRDADDVTDSLQLAALLAGLAFATLFVVGAGLLAAIAGAISLGGEPADLPDTGVARFLGQAGFAVLLVGGGGLAGAFVGLTSIVMLRSRRFPSWLGWAGIVIGVVVGLLSVIFIPLVLFPIWMVVIGILLWRAPSVPVAQHETGTRR